ESLVRCRATSQAKTTMKTEAMPSRTQSVMGRWAVDFARSRTAGADAVHAHERPQHLGHDHGAVGLLAVLDDGDQHAGQAELGAVEGVHELRLRTRAATEPDV